MRRKLIVLALTASGALSVGDAYAYPTLHFPREQTLLERGCKLAGTRIERLLTRGTTTQVGTIQTQVRLLTPGTLAGDIVLERSGSTITVTRDAAISQESFACGDVHVHGSGGSGQAGATTSPSVPTKHVVSVVRETITQPGRYTITFTLNQSGRRIVAQLRAAQRAYAKHHAPGQPPPSITWGVGLHFSTIG
jgi:hypothetical protein